MMINHSVIGSKNLIFVENKPRPARRQKQPETAISKRWRKYRDDNNNNWTENVHSPGILSDSNSDSDLSRSISVESIGVIFELCLTHGGYRNLSMLLYMVLRFFNINWRTIHDFLGNIGMMRCNATHNWREVCLDEDLDKFLRDGWGGKHVDVFYYVLPDLQIEAKAHVSDACSRKTTDFSVASLAKFMNIRFCEITSFDRLDGQLIRSIGRCRLDLTRWGARFETIGQRPYVEGHERSDFVTHSNEFVNYFLDRKIFYYSVIDGDQPIWQYPKQNLCVLMCMLLTDQSKGIGLTLFFYLKSHDKTTFRREDMAGKCWVVGENVPFFRKIRGHSYIISDFLVCHRSEPFFYLNETEYDAAVQFYPNLPHQTELLCSSSSAPAGVNVGLHAHFDNEAILTQFERLFQLLKFKSDYTEYDIEIIVDSAKTHTTKEYSWSQFGKNN